MFKYIIYLLILFLITTYSCKNKSTSPNDDFNNSDNGPPYKYWICNTIDGNLYNGNTGGSLDANYTLSLYVTPNYSGWQGSRELITSITKDGSRTDYQVSDPTPFSHNVGEDFWSITTSDKVKNLSIDISVSATNFQTEHITFTITRTPNTEAPYDQWTSNTYWWKGVDAYLKPE